jgi:PAS domain S-box-containing protein
VSIVDLQKDRSPPRVLPRQEPREPILLGLYVLQRGRLAHVDSHFADILGYAEPAALIGRSIWDLIHSEDRALLRLRRTDRHPTAQPFRAVHAAGHTVRVCLRGDNALYQGRPANIGCMIDVGTMERMRAALGKYRLMLNEVDDAIAEMDLGGNLIFSNTSVCRKWETLGDKTKTMNFRTYVDENWVDAFIQAYKRVYESGASGEHVVYKVKLADGQRLTVEDSVSVMRDETGEATGFRILSRNITDRIGAERKLAAQRSQLEAIFRSVNDAIVTVDPEFKAMESNRSAKQLCGLDLKRKPASVFPDGMRRCNRSCGDVLRRTILDKTSFSDQRIDCGAGTLFRQVVSLNSSPLLTPDGRVMGAVMVMRDITQQESLETEVQQRHQRIIGTSKRIMEIHAMIMKLADLDTTVLITGESGTGKELVAKALHYGGRRASKPFVTVNCSALNESLLESELFGHVKGAFTDAVRDKQGRFEAAEGGTLLLDEIGDASPLIQLKLLRVLQERSFERVGEILPRKADVRVIACTNKDLKQRIGTGEFREDFYYRLKVVQIPLPPLRERIEDIALLMEHFRITFNHRFHKKVKQFSREVLYRFMNYAWPGNVRELEHFIERAFVVCRGSEIRSEHLPADVARGPFSTKSGPNPNELMELLRQARWNKSRAAKFLGVSRQTLYRKMREQNIYG